MSCFHDNSRCVFFFCFFSPFFSFFWTDVWRNMKNFLSAQPISCRKPARVHVRVHTVSHKTFEIAQTISLFRGLTMKWGWRKRQRLQVTQTNNNSNQLTSINGCRPAVSLSIPTNQGVFGVDNCVCFCSLLLLALTKVF